MTSFANPKLCKRFPKTVKHFRDGELIGNWTNRSVDLLGQIRPNCYCRTCLRLSLGVATSPSPWVNVYTHWNTDNLIPADVFAFRNHFQKVVRSPYWWTLHFPNPLRTLSLWISNNLYWRTCSFFTREHGAPCLSVSEKQTFYWSKRWLSHHLQ